VSSQRLNFGERLGRFAKTPPEEDCKLSILEGSVRSGKTWAQHAKILWGCRYNVAGWKVLTGVTKDTVFKNVLNDLFSLIGPHRYSYNHQSGLLRIDRSTWTVMGAKDEGSEKFIRGLTVGYVVCDELSLMPFEFLQMLITRMSPEGARLYGSTNADTPLHPLRTEILDNQKLTDAGLLYSMHCTMDDNPNLTEEYKKSQELLYTGLFYQRYIKGLWVMAEGVIYRDAWKDESTFTDKDLPVGLMWGGQTRERVISVDYGTVNPNVFLDWRDDGVTAWCYNEKRWDSAKEMKQKTDSELADDLYEFTEHDQSPQIVVDPSAASFKQELTNRGWWVTDAVNDVQSGISKTSTALAKGVIRFHRDNCKATIAEFQTYAWDPKRALRGIEEPIKSGDHGCFIAGTKIMTPDGERNIEEFRAGDRVLTPLGQCKVLTVREIPDQQIVEWHRLRGLPNHPIATRKGWTRIDATRYNEQVCEWNPEHSTVSFSGAIQKLKTGLAAIISGRARFMVVREWRAFTGKCGKNIMVLFQKAMMFITRMMIPETMTSPIWNCCPGLFMIRFLERKHLMISSTLPEYGHWLKHGTHHQKDWTGIEIMGKKRCKNARLLDSSVRTAVRIFFRNSAANALNSALTSAIRLPGVNRAWTMFPRFARHAARLSSLINIKESSIVQSAVKDAGRASVFALRTEHGCYYANGILVSNCDAARYFCATKIPVWRLM